MTIKTNIKIIAVLLLLFLSFSDNALSNDQQYASEKESAQNFILELYADVLKGDYEVLEEYDFEDQRGKEIMRYMIQVNLEDEIYIENLGFIELYVTSRDPLIFEIIIREHIKSYFQPPPYFDRLFILKYRSLDNWIIVNITEPGL